MTGAFQAYIVLIFFYCIKQMKSAIVKIVFCIIISMASCFSVFSQSTRTCEVSRINEAIKIDGNLTEEAWKNAKKCTGFVELSPVSGQNENPGQRTEVMVLYDNAAIYVGAILHDVSADSISKDITPRDDYLENPDAFMFLLDTYNTGTNGYGFMVTAANSQYDALYSNEEIGEDISWDAVWESATKLVGHNWMVEMKIPYSALRFAKKDIQIWGINFVRNRKCSQQQLYWNPIDPTKQGYVNQWGKTTGLNDIKPPVRLSFTPYFSSYLDHYKYDVPGVKNTSVYFNGGMDLKYGINQSFTLDMTLIPDFGQVQSDNKILNLSPFEVKYNENRAFFTEGTELFKKGGLFYTRRIGGTPINHDSVKNSINSGETIINNPIETKLINATKISGRTKHGLGIGIFNIVTQRMFADIEDQQGKHRKILSQPLTNYNIFVLDQSLKNNSSVTFINTNAWGEGQTFNDNVASGLFNLFTKNKKYNLSGQLAQSNLKATNAKNITGYFYEISGGKISGNFNAIITHSFIDQKYDPNAMGILYNNNQISDLLKLTYSIYKPGSWYNNITISSNSNYSQRNFPRSYQNFNQNFYISAYLKNLWNISLNLEGSPLGGNDFYEARVPGRIYRSPASYSANLTINTNRAKKYAFNTSLVYYSVPFFNGHGIDLSFDQKLMISKKFRVELSISYMPRNNNVGYATTLSSMDSIIFGRRNINTVENILSCTYNFSTKMNITLRLRHYLSAVSYRQYYLLNQAGKTEETYYNSNNNIDFNLFNVDCVYSWRFAPGSQLSIAWKNSIQTNEDKIVDGYFNNLNNTVKSPQQNSLSIKFLYYIDYSKLSSVFHKIIKKV